MRPSKLIGAGVRLVLSLLTASSASPARPLSLSRSVAVQDLTLAVGR